MYSSLTVNHVITALPNERTIHIPIRLSNGMQTIETTALIDFRATGNFIDVGLLCLPKFLLEELPQLIIANNVNGTTNAKGTIQWKAHTNILFKERTEKLKLMVLSLGRKQIILGMPWLKKCDKKGCLYIPFNAIEYLSSGIGKWSSGKAS